MDIRHCDLKHDQETLLRLWAAAFGSAWPMEENRLRQVAFDPAASRPGDAVLASTDGQPAGFALTRVDGGSSPGGSLLALGVLPEFRRRGVGTALHQAALARLRERGAKRIQLGAGANDYFWPGVPASLAGAWAFFQAQAWPRVESSFDLARSLENYVTPAWVWERVNGLGLEFRAAAPTDEGTVLGMVAAEEVGWLEHYACAFRPNPVEEVLVASRKEDGALLGAGLVNYRARRWSERFSGPVAAPACILTAEAARSQGIGLAITALATERARERGCRTSFIGWTWLVDWYGKLGYKVWEENIMSWRN
jgi:beta-N-acetylhexosaminidase